MPGNCAFNRKWLSDEKYSRWLIGVSDRYKARCKICLKDIDIGNMGESALKRHALGQKHVDLMKSIETTVKVEDLTKTNQPQVVSGSFIPGPSTSGQNSDGSSGSAITITVKEQPKDTKSKVMDSFVSSREVLGAEILWTLKTVTSHYSYSSCGDIKEVLQSMFKDSKIAEKFTCGETKCAYLTKFGLAPYFKQLLMKSIKESGEYVLLFDESLNGVTKSKQLDVHIRLWQKDEVVTRYLGSEFMGHATAQDLKERLRSAMEGLVMSKLVQISMDGPNVNWKFYEAFQSELRNECNVTLLNIGSCGLHVVNGAFKDGVKATGWDLDRFFSSLFWLFKDTPARREYFTSVTDTSTFPLKFCNHRWLENTTVCERALLILPQVVKYAKLRLSPVRSVWIRKQSRTKLLETA